MFTFLKKPNCQTAVVFLINTDFSWYCWSSSISMFLGSLKVPSNESAVDTFISLGRDCCIWFSLHSNSHIGFCCNPHCFLWRYLDLWPQHTALYTNMTVILTWLWLTTTFRNLFHGIWRSALREPTLIMSSGVGHGQLSSVDLMSEDRCRSEAPHHQRSLSFWRTGARYFAVAELMS